MLGDDRRVFRRDLHDLLYATWLPGYLEVQRHLSVSAAGLLTSVPLTAGFFGALASGPLVQAQTRRGWAPVDACRFLVVAAMLATAGFTLGRRAGARRRPGDRAAVRRRVLGQFGFQRGLDAGRGDRAGRDVGSLEAIQNVGGSIGGALAPAITGYVVQASGSFVPALAVAAAIALMTAGIYALGIRQPAAHAPT